VIPGNDDALRAIRLFTSKISDSVVEGVQMSTDKQFADATAGVTALPVAEAHVGEEGEHHLAPETLEAGADSTAAESESEEVDMETALGGGIRKAPAAVGAVEPEAIAEARH
jgi:small subunit ribosomal protein S2